MGTRQQPFEFAASSLLPGALKEWAKPLDPALLKLFVPEELVRSYSRSRMDGQTAAEFASQMLTELDIGYAAAEGDSNRIPKSGAALVVANHPFGLLEGLILVHWLERIRPDFRIVANGVLATTPALRQKVFFVNPFQGADPAENARSVRAAREWLRSGGLLVMFPAGEVSCLNWGAEKPVADPEWKSTAARLAMGAGCPVAPVFFEGANSLNFQMLGAIHPGLRTLNLAHELVNKRRRTMRLRVGTAISAAILKSCGDAETATQYLRARTYLLSSRPKERRFQLKFPAPGLGLGRKAAIRAAQAEGAMAREVESLGESRTLVDNGEFKVVVAEARKIPCLLDEIGRLREVTYRAVGEGTGRARDLDRFDEHYLHLALWHKERRQLAGAYRLAATPDVLPVYGAKGLYTSTLFRYAPEFFERIGPAIELGRSFVCPDYQKMYAPLLLLWKAIAAYVGRRPECPVLFGAVSISGEYQKLSRRLMVDYLGGHSAGELARLVRARRRYRSAPLAPKAVKSVARYIRTLDELSASVQDLEMDGKGVPVLIRQYMKIGGEVLGFNVDPRFSNALDALVMADLRVADGGMLERLMGREGARRFRARHAPGEAAVH